MRRPRFARVVATPEGPEERARGLSYAGSGVDVDEEARSVAALVGALGAAREGKTGRPIPLPGGFAGLVELGDDALALCTDGVGSKIEIARAMQRYDTIGIDCIAMNVNDCVCVGAEPLAFVDYLAVERHDAAFMAGVGRGLARGAALANVTVVGGETATLPGIVRGFDLAGTCLGVVSRERVVTGKQVAPGDAIIGLGSFGIHSNGYTLVRRIVEEAGLDYADPFPGAGGAGRRLGEVLLEPTRIYVRAVLRLLESDVPVHGLAHVTGGGLENIPRLQADVAYVLDEPLAPQPVFAWLAEAGGVSEREMLRTFNMGMGFVVVVPEAAADEAVRRLSAAMSGDAPLLVPGNAGEPPRVVGHVERGRGVRHGPSGIRFGE